MNPCKIPTIVDDIDGDGRWMSIHNKFLSKAKEKDADVVFIGDSIIQALQHCNVWDELFAPFHCLNLGIHRDLIQNVLWRIENGELDHVKPKVIVLHVGTNNHKNKVEEIIDGIEHLVTVIREKHPEAYIILPTLLPRGQFPNPIRDKLKEVNVFMKQKFSNMPLIELIKIDEGLIQSDGTISHHDMYDYLLLTNSGCKKVFESLHELLVQLLTESDVEKELLSE